MRSLLFFSFFFNDTATTEIYTLSLHDALPISSEEARGLWKRLLPGQQRAPSGVRRRHQRGPTHPRRRGGHPRSEEHTSELQSQSNLVCRLLLEKKKKKKKKKSKQTNQQTIYYK